MSLLISSKKKGKELLIVMVAYSNSATICYQEIIIVALSLQKVDIIFEVDDLPDPPPPLAQLPSVQTPISPTH